MPKRRSGKKSARKKPGAKKSPYLVFISHSSKNTWIAHQMSKELEALGASTWLDSKDLRGGDIWQEKILKAIEDCQEGLVLVSPDSVNSWWVAFEIGALSGQRKTVTPILNGVDPKSMASMGDVQAIDLNDFDKFLVQLKGRMK